VLSNDAKVYLETLFRKRRDELLKQREIDRRTTWRNIIHFEDAEKVVGYINMFQPDCDFISRVAHAHADAVEKAYALDDQLLTQEVIDRELMPEVEKILRESVGGVLSREKGRIELLQTRTRQIDTGVSAKLGSLTRHFTQLVNDTQRRIRDEATIRMLEMKKKGTSSKKAETDSEDYRFARIALEESRKSIAEDRKPHPKVGAVVVKNGKVLAVAHRGEAPGNHAEFTALEQKLSDSVVAGATVYTTLEPCTTRNPPKVPCVERLIERKVARVVIGMLDPDERITGRGLRQLTEANIVTDLFPHSLRIEIEELNREFTRHCKQQNRTDKPASSETSQSSERTIPEEERSRIIEALKSHAPRLVDIAKSPEDPEVYELTRQIESLLTEAGWKPTVLPLPPAEPVSGIVIDVDSKNPPNVTVGNALATAFSKAGLNVQGPNTSFHTPLTGVAIRITVGRNRRDSRTDSLVDSKVLEAVLLPLADQYEAGLSNRWVTLRGTSPEEQQPFRETMAALRAEGSVRLSAAGDYQLTSTGYAKYANKIKALRVPS
jgi:pyrimidine deaminase RibD-like protein